MVYKLVFFKSLAGINKFKLRFLNENNSINACEKLQFFEFMLINVHLYKPFAAVIIPGYPVKITPTIFFRIFGPEDKLQKHTVNSRLQPTVVSVSLW